MTTRPVYSVTITNSKILLEGHEASTHSFLGSMGFLPSEIDPLVEALTQAKEALPHYVSAPVWPILDKTQKETEGDVESWVQNLALKGRDSHMRTAYLLAKLLNSGDEETTNRLADFVRSLP